jgi:1,4-alpha-glucan branching enzyme
MLYLDYSREEGEWEPNIHGGNENLEAIEFIRQFNEAVYREYPDVQTIAEESTAWPGVSRPLYVGGLGFGLKWNMGWMHDTLDYMKQDPVYRKFHHDRLTFSIMYTFTENFVLSLSHDEVVHGKGSILNKMPGDIWQKHANLRALYGYMWSHPGKKMLFMGSEFGQYREWNHDDSLDWHLLENPEHQGLLRWMRDLNTFYRAAPSLYDQDFNPDGFAWVDFRDTESSIICYLRYSTDRKHMTLVVCNFTPMPRNNYRVGVPKAGFWKEALNSDAHIYGGSGWGNLGGVDSKPVASHGHYDSISLNIPPLSVMYLTPEPEATQEP